MSKLTLDTIATGLYSTQALNNNFADIVSAFENTLSLDGTTPNSLSADLDLDGNDILNIRSFGFNVYTVATVPSAVTLGAGSMIYVSNGDSGVACLAVSNGTAWKRVSLGATIAAS